MNIPWLFNFYSAVYAIFACSGIFGNSVVLAVIALNKTMHTTANFFIASMALSDVIFIGFGVPLNIYVLQADQGWQLGSVTCSLFWYLMYVTVLVTCMTISLLSIDRLLAFKYPVRSLEYRQPKNALRASLVVWIFCLVVCMPAGFSTWPNPTETSKYCSERWSKEKTLVWYSLFFAVSYIVPLTVICICYGSVFKLMNSSNNIPMENNTQGQAGTEMLLQRRRRVTIMVSIITICFVIIWGPIHVINLVIRISSLLDDEFEDWKLVVALTCRAMMYLGSSINPVIYAFVGQHFRTKLAETIATITSNNTNNHNHLAANAAAVTARNTNKTRSTKEVAQSVRKNAHLDSNV